MRRSRAGRGRARTRETLPCRQAARSRNTLGCVCDAPSFDFSWAITTKMPLEPTATPVPRPRQILADFGGSYASNAVVAFLFACTGPVAIILSVGARGGLDGGDIAWGIF